MNTVIKEIESKVAKTTDAQVLGLISQFVKGMSKALNVLVDDTVSTDEYTKAFSMLNTLASTFDLFIRNYPLDDTLRRMTSGNRLEEAQAESIENQNIQMLFENGWLTQEKAAETIKEKGAYNA